MRQRLDVLAKITGGKICSGAPALSVSGLFTDTRTPVRGGLFLALRGDRFDGNLFAREAIETLGAAAVLLDCPWAVSSVPMWRSAKRSDNVITLRLVRCTRRSSAGREAP